MEVYNGVMGTQAKPFAIGGGTYARHLKEGVAFGMLFPNMPIYIMFIPVPIKAKWVVIGYGVIEVLSGISSMSGVSADNVAHFAHLGGMLFGIIMLLIWKKKGVINNGFGGY